MRSSCPPGRAASALIPWIGLLLAAVLAACAAPPTPTAGLTPLPLLPATATPPAITATPLILPTQTASPAPTLTPAATAGPTATPVLAQPPACANDAEFDSDLTVPDGAQYLPGQTFVKRWRVRNAGTCDWGPDYRLVFVSGEPLTAFPGTAAQTEFALYPARAGTTGVWEIPMRAPDEPGQYTGRWQARDPQGHLFGKLVFVTIDVIPLPATPTP